jgi:hypothetical protein
MGSMLVLAASLHCTCGVEWWSGPSTGLPSGATACRGIDIVSRRAAGGSYRWLDITWSTTNGHFGSKK